MYCLHLYYSFCFISLVLSFLLHKRKPSYDWRIRDCSSDVCASDLSAGAIDRNRYAKAAPAFAYRFRSIAPAEAPGNRPPPRASLRATDRRDGQADRHRPPPEARSAPARRRCGKAEGQCRSCSQRIGLRSPVYLALFPRRRAAMTRREERWLGEKD